LQAGTAATVLVIILQAASRPNFAKRPENAGYQASDAFTRSVVDYHFSPSSNHRRYSIDN
jgi:hypothetical protein